MNDTYKILKNVISQDLCNFVASEFKLIRDLTTRVDTNFGRTDAKEVVLTDSYSVYCLICFEALSLHLQPLIEQAVGKTLYPSYTYGRIYANGAELKPHYDRRSSEYTLSCCISKDPKDWLLAIENSETKEVSEILLEQGDVLLYQGRIHQHWRTGPFNGQEQVQVFIQYVDTNGNSPDLKWDARPSLGLPFSYAGQQVHNEMNDIIKRSGNLEQLH
jgi:hypothetical protein